MSYNKSINRLPNEIWLESSTAIRNRFGIHVAKGIANRSTLQALVANLSEQPLCIPANTIIAYGCSLSKDWKIIENSPLSFNLLLDENKEIIDNTTDNNISDESSTQSNTKLIDNKTKQVNELLKILDWSNDKLNDDEINEFKHLINKYSNLFKSNDDNLSQTTLISHRIPTGNSKPINTVPYRTNPTAKSRVDKIVQEHLKKNFIRPSNSPWASPIVLASKKDGSIRFCIDYRKLNEKTVTQNWPIPRILDL